VKNILPILHSAVAVMTPLLFAATGGLFTELAGTLNIALEGLLLAGAFSALAAAYYTGSFAAGLAAGMCASLALSTILAFTTVKLRSNVFIGGLAINLLAGGLTVVLSQYFFGTRGVVSLRGIDRLPLMDIRIIGKIPLLGALLSGHSLYVYGSWLLLFCAWLTLYKTPFGYRLRACGKHSTALESLGINPAAYRLAAFLVSGFCCGIGGSFLSLNLGAYVPNMTAGRGWIALVVIYLGGRRPQGLPVAAFIIGLSVAFSNYAQGQYNIPADFILAVPYLLTFLAMVFTSITAKRV
jgi:simple sugar transport system permease protein